MLSLDHQFKWQNIAMNDPEVVKKNRSKKFAYLLGVVALVVYLFTMYSIWKG